MKSESGTQLRQAVVRGLAVDRWEVRGSEAGNSGGVSRAAMHVDGIAEAIARFPQLRFMGSKYRLLPWLREVFAGLDFETALDAFSGSGAVAYLLKAMGKSVTTNDFLNMGTTIARALIENSAETMSAGMVARLRHRDPNRAHFIENTFRNIFYTPVDLRFLDSAWSNLSRMRSQYQRAIALSALIRACVKRQPRGVFTVAGDLANYDDGRRDLRLSLEQHFLEQVEAYNACVFSNGRSHRALRADVFDIPDDGFDLVYLDPPYVPRADDNCYMKRYHFLEGLSCYWQGLEILEGSRVKKVAKPYTPFSYRRDALGAFGRLFAKFRASIIVLSYSSNGYPDLDVLVDLLQQQRKTVAVHEREHRYHFGTHANVQRATTTEYLIVAR